VGSFANYTGRGWRILTVHSSTGLGVFANLDATR